MYAGGGLANDSFTLGFKFMLNFIQRQGQTCDSPQRGMKTVQSSSHAATEHLGGFKWPLQLQIYMQESRFAGDNL